MLPLEHWSADAPCFPGFEGVGEAETHGRVLGVRVPEAEPDAEEPWRMPPSRRAPEAPIPGPLPSRVEFVLADELYIDRSALPPLLITRLAGCISCLRLRDAQFATHRSETR